MDSGQLATWAQENYGTTNQQQAQIAKAAEKQPEVPGQLDRLERALKGCTQGLDTLGARLEQSVVRPLAEATTASGQQGQVPHAVATTGLGARISVLVQAASHLNDRIQSITARLEA